MSVRIKLSLSRDWQKRTRRRTIGVGVNMQLNESYGVVSLMLVSSRARKNNNNFQRDLQFFFQKNSAQINTRGSIKMTLK
jgi:hypothetical protein